MASWTSSSFFQSLPRPHRRDSEMSVASVSSSYSGESSANLLASTGNLLDTPLSPSTPAAPAVAQPIPIAKNEKTRSGVWGSIYKAAWEPAPPVKLSATEQGSWPAEFSVWASMP